MRLLGLLLGCVLAAVPLAAQATAPAAPDLKLLYQQAKSALKDVPDALAPYDLDDIARQEDIRYPKLAVQDYAQAFREAVALTDAKEDGDAWSHFRWAEKQNVELQSIVGVAHHADSFNLAHQLARTADAPRYRLYTELIGAAADAAREKAGAGQPAEQGLLAETFGGIGFTPKRVAPPAGIDPGYDVQALAEECFQADGTYPFLGVMIALSAYHRDGVDQRPLLLDAYRAAGSVTPALAMSSAVGVFLRGHMMYPDLDQQLESAALALLNHLQNGAQNPPPATGNAGRDRYNAAMTQSDISAGAHLLAILEQIDQTRAEELKAQYSIFADPQTPIARKISDLTAPQRAANADPATAVAQINQMPTISDQEKEAKYKAAAHLAITLSQANPKPAAEAADEALDLLTDPILNDNLRLSAQLAQRMADDLHEQAKAEDLTRRCLDAAEAKAVAAEQAFDNAGDDAQPGLTGDFEGVGSDEVEAFVYASMVDYNLALQRATQTSADYFKPLFLLRVAAGQELEQPWWK